VKSVLVLSLTLISIGLCTAEEPAKAKARARAALALAAVCEDCSPPKAVEKSTHLTDLTEAKAIASREGKPLVIWVGMDPIDLRGVVSVKQDEHAGIRDRKAAIVYPSSGGQVSGFGHVEFQPTVAVVSSRVQSNKPPPPPPSKVVPAAVPVAAPSAGPFYVRADPLPVAAPAQPTVTQALTPVCVGSV
jgi:hypothetical protein